MSCHLPFDQNEMNAVEGRLMAYRLYKSGPVCWTHPDLPRVVTCPQPEDYDNPNTFHLPTFCKRKPTRTVHNDFIEVHDCWSWGTLHAEVEMLFFEGWSCQAPSLADGVALPNPED